MKSIRLPETFPCHWFVPVVLSFFALCYHPLAMSQLPAAFTPSFSPPSGSYIAPQTVQISDSTFAATTIYYTLDGTTPTSSSSVYTDPITVTSSETIQAIAMAPGYSQSAVGSATYAINGWLYMYLPDGGAGTFPGESTTSRLALQSLNGFAGTVTLSGAERYGTHDAPTLSFGNGSSVNLTSGGSATVVLTFSTSAANRHPAFPWTQGGETLFALMVFVGIPARRKIWRSLVSVLGLACLASALSACGGTSGTTPGNYYYTVTATSGTKTATITVAVAVFK